MIQLIPETKHILTYSTMSIESNSLGHLSVIFGSITNHKQWL